METLAPTLRAKDQEIQRLRADVAELAATLNCFMRDTRFVVSVGGNPLVVERMIEHVNAVLAKHGA